MSCPHPAGVLTSLLAHTLRPEGQNFSGSARIEGGAEGSHFRIFSTRSTQTGSTAAAFRLHPAAARSKATRKKAARGALMAPHHSRRIRAGSSPEISREACAPCPERLAHGAHRRSARGGHCAEDRSTGARGGAEADRARSRTSRRCTDGLSKVRGEPLKDFLFDATACSSGESGGRTAR